jgi:hypothetical protein
MWRTDTHPLVHESAQNIDGQCICGIRVRKKEHGKYLIKNEKERDGKKAE